MSDPAPFALGAAAGLALVPLLAAFARRVGWLDPPPWFRGRAALKRQTAPVPPVGGAGVLVVAVAAHLAGHSVTAPALASTGLAFAVGLTDDLLPRGLSPLGKVVGQLLASLPFALASSTDAFGAVGLVLVALVAQNAANTFDHTDGFCALLAVFGLARPAPLVAGAAAGFLPWNLTRGADGAPRAFLGDSGSHVVGMAIAVHPASWPVLALPLLDLARLSVQRLARGSRPWIGDREHLGHVLERRGLGPLARCAVVALLLAVSNTVSGIL